jgi:hypothetical protein
MQPEERPRSPSAQSACSTWVSPSDAERLGRSFPEGRYTLQ